MKYLSRLASGQCLGAWGLTEPNAGSDAASLQTTAVKDGDEWVLNGRKQFITHGKECEIAVVLTSTDKSLGNKGITAFVVEQGTPGFGPGSKENKLGLRASESAGEDSMPRHPVSVVPGAARRDLPGRSPKPLWPRPAKLPRKRQLMTVLMGSKRGCTATVYRIRTRRPPWCV